MEQQILGVVLGPIGLAWLGFCVFSAIVALKA